MKKIDIILLICIILLAIIVVGYSFLDIVFSFGIISSTIDIRIELLIIGHALLVVFLGLILIKVAINKKNKSN